MRSLMDGYRDRATIFLGGPDMITADMVDFIKSDLAIFGTGILIFVIVYPRRLFSASLRWVILPLSTCALCLVIILGFLSWIDWRLTVISSNFVSLLLNYYPRADHAFDCPLPRAVPHPTRGNSGTAGGCHGNLNGQTLPVYGADYYRGVYVAGGQQYPSGDRFWLDDDHGYQSGTGGRVYYYSGGNDVDRQGQRQLWQG